MTVSLQQRPYRTSAEALEIKVLACGITISFIQTGFSWGFFPTAIQPATTDYHQNIPKEGEIFIR